MILVKISTNELVDIVDSALFREDNNSIEVSKAGDVYQYSDKEQFSVYDAIVPENVTIGDYSYIDGNFIHK